MTTKPVDVRVAFLGNCIDSGAGVRPGNSFVELTEQSIRRQAFGASVAFRHLALPHATLLDEAITEVLREGPDVVAIGACSVSLVRPVALNRLWKSNHRTLQAAESYISAIDRRLGAGSSASKGMRKVRFAPNPLRQVVAPMSPDAYRSQFLAGIARLREARCRVVLRGGFNIESHLGIRANPVADSILEDLARETGVAYVSAQEGFVGDVRALIAEGGLGRPNEAGHRVIANVFEPVVASTVMGVLRARVDGEPPVLARATSVG